MAGVDLFGSGNASNHVSCQVYAAAVIVGYSDNAAPQTPTPTRHHHAHASTASSGSRPAETTTGAHSASTPRHRHPTGDVATTQPGTHHQPAASSTGPAASHSTLTLLLGALAGLFALLFVAAVIYIVVLRRRALRGYSPLLTSSREFASL